MHLQWSPISLRTPASLLLPDSLMHLSLTPFFSLLTPSLSVLLFDPSFLSHLFLRVIPVSLFLPHCSCFTSPFTPFLFCLTPF